MPIVTLRNKHNYKKMIGFDLKKNRIVTKHVNGGEECGDYIVLNDGSLVGFLNAAVFDNELNQFLFFVGEKIYDFRDKDLSTSVKYLNQNDGNFILKINDKEVENITYPRSMSADFGGWLVGNWETEEEKDIFMNIHEIVIRIQNA